MARPLVVAFASAPLALIGCSDDDLPTRPPTAIEEVTSGGFISPTDAVASPDGKTFYFGAYIDDEERAAAIFRVAAAPGSTAEVLATGAPLEMPIGLVMSCDGKTVYVADKGMNEDGGVIAVSTSGELTDLGATGILGPAGLAMAKDCKTLYLTGRAPEGEPALLSMPVTGGAAAVVYKGEPLESPTGLHIDDDNVSWVMDHLAHGDNGQGVLFAIPADGSAATVVVSDLRMGTPGGVSLTAGGGTAVMPTVDANGAAQLTSVDIKSGELTQLATPEISDPAGLRSARGAGVFAVVDSEGGKIFLAK